jgi:putative 4-mercaptohistidine N1-methyltranferase
LTEAEHHVLRGIELDTIIADADSDRVMSTSGDQFANGEDGSANLNLAYGSASPVTNLPPSSTGHHDVMGNNWEWTEDHFNPLPGFEFHHVYDDFSMPCFDGKHHMIMGGSFVSTGDEASAFARFHFRQHFLQHSGFRLVSSSTTAPATNLKQVDAVAEPEQTQQQIDNLYETETLVHQYLGLHFPSSGIDEQVSPIIEHDNAPDYALRFPQRVAQLAAQLKPVRTNGRALDVGCSVGGSSFELATQFDEVLAFDFSEAFIVAAQAMARGDEVKFNVPFEAEASHEVLAVHESNVGEAERKKVQFYVGDACQLVHDKPRIGTFDAVILANLLCRLPTPLDCLDGLQEVVNPGGVAVIATPFSWLEQYTHRSKWLGGYHDPVSGAVISSKDRLRHEMEARGFIKIHEEQMPLVIREHRRKYQYIVSEATGWRKI